MKTRSQHLAEEHNTSRQGARAALNQANGDLAAAGRILFRMQTQETQLNQNAHTWSPPPPPANSFNVVSWNVQADQTRGFGHDGKDRSALEKCLGILMELSPKPDIIVLVELQRCKRQTKTGDCNFCQHGNCPKDHAQWITDRLSEYGYDGQYHNKGKMINTVGLYYNKATFEKTSELFFANFDAKFGIGIKSKKGAVFGILRHKKTGQKLLVAAVHLSVPLKDRQPNTAMQVGEVEQLKAKLNDVLQRSGNNDLPLLLAGDFNSTFERSRKPNIAPPDVYNMITTWEQPMRSAYKVVNREEPKFTAWKPDPTEFCECIDYIFGSHHLHPITVRQLPSRPPREEAWPSDHLLLAATYQFVNCT